MKSKKWEIRYKKEVGREGEESLAIFADDFYEACKRVDVALSISGINPRDVTVIGLRELR